MFTLEEKIQDALLEALFLTRWDSDKQTMNVILSNLETKQAIRDVISELDNAGLKIVEKELV